MRLKVLSKQIKKIRTFVKARFDKRPEIAVLFEPVPKGRGGAATAGSRNPTENPIQPAG